MAIKSPVLRVSDGYLSDLDRRAADAVARLLKRYGAVERSLLQAITRLETQIGELESPTPAQLYRLDRYVELLRLVGVQMGDYGAVMAESTRSAISDAVRLGAEAALQLGAASALDPLMRQAFTRFDPRTVAIATGMTGPSSPLMQMLTGQYGAAWVEAFSATFVTNVALGRSPRDVVSSLRQLVEVTARADITRIARTAQLWAYREANRQTWEQTGMVTGWIWHSALRPGRTCIACYALHGSKHSIRETLNDHWNGLCVVSGTMVTTKRGDVPIESVVPGDEVLTHMGRWRKVLSTSSHPHEGGVVSLSSGPASVTITPEHRVMTQRGWVAAQDLRADDTLWILNSKLVRSSSRNTFHPSCPSRASLRASIGRLMGDLCHLGSSSTASISSGNAKSMLNCSTANCGTGNSPAPLSAASHLRSFGDVNFCQCVCRNSAFLRSASGVCPLRMKLSKSLGLRLYMSANASVGVRAFTPPSRMSRMTDRVLIPDAAQIASIPISSSRYLRRTHSTGDSPSLSLSADSHLAAFCLPASFGPLLNPSVSTRCVTALTDLPTSADISRADSDSYDSRIVASSDADQGFPPMGSIIHQSSHMRMHGDYNGLVYDLEVEGDHSFIAGGVVVHNCVAVPVLQPSRDYPAENIGIDTGETIFGRLARAEQERIAESSGWGPFYRAWKAGDVQFNQAIGRYTDASFGAMVVAKSLKSILGAEQARAYYR